MNNKKKNNKTSIQVDNTVHSKVKQYCSDNGLILSTFVEKAIIEKIENGK